MKIYKYSVYDVASTCGGVTTVACLTHAKKLACYCAVFAYGSHGT